MNEGKEDECRGTWMTNGIFVQGCRHSSSWEARSIHNPVANPRVVVPGRGGGGGAPPRPSGVRRDGQGRGKRGLQNQAYCYVAAAFATELSSCIGCLSDGYGVLVVQWRAGRLWTWSGGCESLVRAGKVTGRGRIGENRNCRLVIAMGTEVECPG
ncbi:uncharacterized protein [Physcomitrium patens]|uniref:uncharacterized protein n=1 Tax=Physcomitrium patens TaxID=3218 RepID=UPI003CCDD185